MHYLNSQNFMNGVNSHRLYKTVGWVPDIWIDLCRKRVPLEIKKISYYKCFTEKRSKAIELGARSRVTDWEIHQSWVWSLHEQLPILSFISCAIENNNRFRHFTLWIIETKDNICKLGWLCEKKIYIPRNNMPMNGIATDKGDMCGKHYT